MLVEVRPIETTKWHGKMKDESFKRPNKLQALLDPVTMRYATGLTEKDIDHLKNDLKVNYDLTDVYRPDRPHPFWDSTLPVVKLENQTMFFNTDNPIEFIKVKMMKASKYVANSMREYEEGKYPEATHVIHDESEEVHIEASKVALKNQAIIESSKLSSEKKAQIILLVTGKLVKGMSDDFITVEMNKAIEESPADVVRYINMDKGHLALEALVHECLEKNVLQKQGHKILYHDSVLGTDESEVVDYLEQDENQDLKLRLMNQVSEA